MVDYNPNIPQGTDNLSTSQGQIQNNFNQLNTIIAFNHYPYDDSTSANRGLHKKIDFPIVLGSDPTVTGTASVFYSKAVTGVAQAFFANSAGAQQMTGFVSSLGATGTITFPGGLIMKWGQYNMGSGVGSVQVNYPVAFPNGYFMVTLSSTTSDASQTAGINLSGTNAAHFTSFRRSSGGANLTYFYIALGN